MRTIGRGLWMGATVLVLLATAGACAKKPAEEAAVAPGKSTERLNPAAAVAAVVGVDVPVAVLPPDHPFAWCAPCHGAAGEGNREQLAPRLVGQDATYLDHQVQSFRKEWRGTHPEDVPGQRMRAIVTAVPAATIARAIAWAAAQPAPRRPDRVVGDRGRGELLYRRSCAVCHGDAGEGDGRYHMARLAQQHGWYVAAQLRAYRSGLRGVHPGDDEGRAMRFYAELLPDDAAVDDVSSWLSRFRRD